MIRRVLLSSVAVLWSGCSTVSDPPGNTAVEVAPGDEVSFDKVRPIFEHRCVRCHGNRVANAGLNLQKRDAALHASRPFIVPGNPESSLVFTAILKPATHPRMMPNDGWKLSRQQLADLHDWISQGAGWPTGRAGVLKERRLVVEFDEAP